MATDPTCSTHGWSIFNSAPTYAGAAGILAGFAFTAAVIYVNRQDQAFDDDAHDANAVARRRKAKSLQDVQTISLFVVSFILLGLDSFIWSMVAGSRPQTGLSGATLMQPAELCSRVSSQAIIGRGMMGLGTIAMACNITSLFLGQQSTIHDEDSRRHLRFFLLIATATAVVSVIVLLGSDAMNYLDVVYAGQAPLWLTTSTNVITFGGLAIAIFLATRAYLRKMQSPHPKTGHFTTKDRMKAPSFLGVLYALFGAIGVTAAARFPDWPDKPVVWVILAYWTLGLVYPVLVVILAARATPPAKPPNQPQLNSHAHEHAERHPRQLGWGLQRGRG